MLLVISTWKMQNFLVSHFAGKLTDAAAIDGEPKNAIIDARAITVRSATEVLW